MNDVSKRCEESLAYHALLPSTLNGYVVVCGDSFVQYYNNKPKP